MPTERPDDFERRRKHLIALSDAALDVYFRELVDKIVAPLIDEARTHTTPAIERSVLLRMGFSSIEAKALVERMTDRKLLGRGAGRVVLEFAEARGVGVREAGAALLKNENWEVLDR